MKRVSEISSPDEFALEDQRELLRDHRAERRRKVAESIASSVCSILIAARPIAVVVAMTVAVLHAPGLFG